MKSDAYLRGVLTVIAGALVYLCVVLTPWPTASAQTTQRPGEFTGPGEFVIAGVKSGVALPVQVMGPVQIGNEVRVVGDMKVTGRVQTEQAPRTAQRVVLVGWEDSAPGAESPGTFAQWSRRSGAALPVSASPR
jgi:hypothetical protein